MKYLRIAKADLIPNKNGYGNNLLISMVASYDENAKYIKFEKINKDLIEKLLNGYIEIDGYENEEQTELF